MTTLFDFGKRKQGQVCIYWRGIPKKYIRSHFPVTARSLLLHQLITLFGFGMQKQEQGCIYWRGIPNLYIRWCFLVTARSLFLPQLITLFDFGMPKPVANLQILKGHTNWETLARYYLDGTQLASRSRDSTIRHWDPKNGKFLQIFDSKFDGYYDLLSLKALWIETQRFKIQLTAAASEFFSNSASFL